MTLPKKKLNNGLEMPVVGLGVWKTQEGQEVENAVGWALACGYRLIDTAKIYGNEKGVGRAIAKSGIRREQIFVTTKLWNEDQGYESAFAAIDGSLSGLNMDYVDLYLIHWPFTNGTTGKNKRVESWRAMEEIYKLDLAKSIGVSNYTIGHLEEMKGYANILPAVNQVEFHPFLFQKSLMEYCQAHQIILEAYCPLASGQKLQDSHIGAIAQKYKKSNAQIMLRWNLQHGNIVIPKSAHQERIEENLKIFDFELEPSDMQNLDDLNEDYRIVNM